ncbi:MAG: hypothetical protein A2Z77_00905 [Chloroflexi bacterium RBG_13_51_36]|nr:MAG: hypothetical protein A2Z77_00905 [Chloroflexi bacterium RBG_13_51_36]
MLIILLAAAILLPFGYALDIGPGPNSVRAVVWEYIDATWFSGFRFVRFGQVLDALLLTLPTYFFIFQLFILYRTSLRPKRMWLAGILGALFPGLVSLFLVIGWLQGWTQPPPPSDLRFPVYIPIPAALVMAIILLKVFPAKKIDEAKLAKHRLE